MNIGRCSPHNRNALTAHLHIEAQWGNGELWAQYTAVDVQACSHCDVFLLEVVW